jgi:hypothetical protein
VGVILAHAFAALERDRGAVLHVAGAGLVAHGTEHGLGEREGPRLGVGDGLQCALGEGAQFIIGRGQLRGGEIGERRERAVVLAAFGVGGFDHAVHDDAEFRGAALRW